MYKMNRTCVFALFAVLFCVTAPLQAQDDAAEIRKTIMTMFDGMREGDSAKVHSVMMKDVIFQRVAKNREGKTVVSNSDFQRFLVAIGTPHDKVWDERIEFGPILIDGDMASVWTPFKFYLGDTFSHCGVNAFKLCKTEEGWKIFHLVDTNRRDNCAMN
ncbi:nuclear transport factor 2 family protein [Roseivirga sp. UBA838]|uniref:nuclear transport factor 2 family protein n=1 Tax=Roseivirga sp. UBA838 TaxID=1947393 RepID=UPI00257EABA8|nr:nuclear transport factor 2 family protein [Roseivirga sp. UBA838]|tara:strand:- start:7512 stop:7988 length:477 start_codon:yes stop_codon:yes gene_type:complete